MRVFRWLIEILIRARAELHWYVTQARNIEYIL